MKKDLFQRRTIIILVVSILISVFGFVRLFALQAVGGKRYVSQSERTFKRTVSVKATRGEIYDRNGEELVTNRRALNVQIDKLTLAGGDLNALIANTIELFKRRGENYSDTFLVSASPFTYLLDLDDVASAKYKKLLSLASIAGIDVKEGIPTPAELLVGLRKYYKVSDAYSDDAARDIIAVRYDMEQRGFSTAAPYVICEDISIDTATQIKERPDLFWGLEITDEAIRVYSAGSTAAHIIGKISAIYKDEYEELKDKGYTFNDVIGRDGAEKAFESYLRGVNGTRTITQNKNGSIINVEAEDNAIPGNNVYLTIDKNLQIMAEKSLDNIIKKISESAKKQNNAKGYDACAGAVVVTSVKTGEILAMASYPTFDLSTYNRDYQSLLAAEHKPLVNRALSGLYAPGSTFKMLTAIAGLEEGQITLKTKVNCSGIYTFYAPTYLPRCWVYNDYGSSHGNINVTTAIQKSCNIFFYDTGRKVGINRLNAYGKVFGLGEYTGIEISGETKGILAGEDYRRSINRPWYDGETLAAAIGQSDNQFTPLQLANYLATIANGGTRYNLHLLKSVNDYVTGEAVYVSEPTVAAQIKMTKENYNAVMEGMRRVTEDGTASSVFSTYPIAVGGKTGSADVGQGSANGVFLAFAPFDDPEISVCIVVEHGAHGNSVAPVARDIFDAYFFHQTYEDIHEKQEEPPVYAQSGAAAQTNGTPDAAGGDSSAGGVIEGAGAGENPANGAGAANGADQPGVENDAGVANGGAVVANGDAGAANGGAEATNGAGDRGGGF